MAHASIVTPKHVSLKSTTVRALRKSGRRLGLQLAQSYVPELAARWLARSFLTPQKRCAALDFSAAQAVLQVHVETRSLEVGVWGSAGPVVLLVHGWGGGGQQYRALREHLVAQGYRVACFDAWAHGGSPASYTHLLQFVELISAVAERLGPLHALVGHSLGGAAAALWASAERGHELPGLVLLAPMPSFEFAMQQFAQALELSSGMQERVSRSLETSIGFDRTQMRLGALRPAAQTLLIHDTSDRAVPVESSRELAQLWADADYLETTGLGHSRPLSDGRVMARVSSFIHSLPPRPSSVLERQLAGLGELCFE
jgi:pimeloyl-ACP methyl ester carboxylesterase